MQDNDEDDVVSRLVFDDRLDSYRSFFDHDWIKTFFEAGDASRLSKACFDLGLDWKGIAVASRMPWLMIDSLKNFHLGFFHEHPAFSRKLTTKFGEYVANNSKLSNMRKKELIQTVENLGKTIQEDMRLSKPLFDSDEVWKKYLQVPEFNQALWSSQRISYSAIYFAYENFIQHCVAIGKSNDSYRAHGFRQSSADFTQLFGDELTNECMMDPQINIARLVRNCLTHDGGRESSELRLEKHQLQIENGLVQILPEHVRNLFNLLKVKALAIAKSASSLSAFMKVDP